MKDDDIASTLNSQDERRRHDRSRLIIDVYFDGNDATGVASTKDISAGGLYMNTQANLPVGSMLMVRIPLSGDRQIVTQAIVVYVDQDRGVGLRFAGMPAQDQQTIERELGNG